MIKRTFVIIVLSFLLAFALLSVSWHLKVFFTYLFLLFLQKTFFPAYSKNKWITSGILLLFLILFWITFPDRKAKRDSYIQSIYFDKETKEIMPEPIIPYLMNIVGEGDIMKTICLASKVMPSNSLMINKSNALKDVIQYFKRTSISENNFIRPYQELAFKDPPAHNVPFQVLKGKGWYKKLDHYYLHIPEKKDPSTCEVIVFCHGYTGNWLLYSTLFSQHTEAIIIAVETPDFKGIFTKDYMNTIIKNTIPHAAKTIGVNISKPHLIGLSNGCTAINNAVKYFPDEFQSYTILSGSLYTNFNSAQKVNVIYGEKDNGGGVSNSIPSNKYVKYIIKNEDHTLFVSKPKIVFDLINSITNSN